MTTTTPLAERIAYALSTKRVRECFESLFLQSHDWKVKDSGEAHRTRPYPMGFYPDNPNLYYANGWGRHEHMFPHERWLVRRAAALRSRSQDNGHAD